MFRGFGPLAVLLLAAFTAGPAVPQDLSHSQLMQLIPEPLPAGAALQGNPSFYSPDNLFQYMDGAADLFVLYGVRTLMHLDLRAGSVDVTVDIFDMGSPDTAFGMYAAERSSGYQFIPMGAEGYRDAGIINFLQDRYYMKLAGFGNGADAVLTPLAHALSAKIGTNPSLPALLARLPQENRKAHSEQYMPKDPLGHPFLGPAYLARYISDGEESQLYVTLARDAADAQQRLRQLAENFVKTGRCEAAPDLGPGAIRASNSFEGRVMAQTEGRYLILLVHPSSGGAALLKRAAESLD
ncbi:MAG: DUF6599 family protein [Acidobacteriota bacterium]